MTSSRSIRKTTIDAMSSEATSPPPSSNPFLGKDGPVGMTAGDMTYAVAP
ncbi:MAG: hypothetical protein IPK78_17500 [Rhodospirillales bacterium]|nr:hypothetical protein [Rhodospirillales bacterium]